MNVRNTGLVCGVAVVALIGTGCGDGGGGGGPTQPLPSPTIASVEVSPGEGTLVSLGETVTLQATARDAAGGTMSASFTWSSDETDVVEVDASGVATAVANGSATITASAGGESGEAVVVVAQRMDSLEVVQGDAQVGSVGLPLDTLIQVLALDAGGSPAVGIAIAFTAAGEGTVDPAVATTDAEGMASAAWTLGSAPGEYTLEVGLDGDATSLETLTATGFADIPAAMALLDGDAQMELVSMSLPAPIRVRLVDEFDNPVVGVPVEFSADGGGTVDPAEALTDLEGVAAAIWTLGPGTGDQTAQALVRDSAVLDVVDLPGSPVSFNASAVPFELIALSADPAVVGQTLTLDGTGFDPVPGNNLVEIGGVVAPVIEGTQTSLTVEVPSFGCAAATARDVAVTRGDATEALSAAVHPAGPLDLAVGESAVVADPDEFCLQFLGSETGTDEYLVGLTGTRALDAHASFEITADDGAAPAPSAATAVAEPASTPLRIGSGSTSLDGERREWERSFLATQPALAASVTTADLVRTTAALKDAVNLRVPDIDGDRCNDYTAVASTVLHVDDGLVIASPLGPVLVDLIRSRTVFLNILLSLGDLFTATIRDQVRAYIGDVDAEVTVLLTPAFNDVGIPAFSTVVDLTDRATCPASDERLVVYVAIPSLDYTSALNLAGLADALGGILQGAGPRLTRELTHLRQNVRRLDAGIARPLPNWLASGQAELLVEVVGQARRGDQNGMDYGSAVVNADLLSTRWYLPRFEQLSYLFGWNGSSGRVGGAPEQCSLFGFPGLSTPCVDAHAQGAAWSFVRYLSDRIGPHFAGGEAGFHQALVTTADANELNDLLETFTGFTLPDLILEWAMTLYTDGRLTPQQAPELQITSWDLADIYDAMSAVRRLEPAVFGFEGFSRTGTVVGGGTAYLRIDAGGAHGPLAVEVRDPLGNPLGADIGPRLWVVRIR